MATNREDFVIAIRSAFLKKVNKQKFSLIGLIFFSIALIILGKINLPVINYLKISLNEIVYRSSFIVSIPQKKINESIKIINDHYLVYEDYRDIKTKLKDLQLQSKKYEIEFIIQENLRLRKLIDEYIYNSEELIAKVLIDKKSPFLRSIIINKGTKDKVELGMAVLDGSYLIGKIVETNYSTSRALLISDLNSKIPVITEPAGHHAILSGKGKNDAALEYLPENHNIKNGDKVYTSGKEGIFSPGIPIGEIKIKDKNNVSVSLFSDLNQVTFVNISLEEINSK